MMASAPIPNQHFDVSTQIDRNNTRLLIYGVPRSGSTWMWQVMGDIFENGVIRTHRFMDVSRGIPLLITVRDWRDALISYWRSHFKHARIIEREEIYQYVGKYQEHIWTAGQWRKERPDGVVLRYEDSLKDPESLFTVASEQLYGPEISPARKTVIMRAHSIEVNKAIADNLQRQDRATLMNPCHVHEAGVGTWRNFCDEEGAKLLTDLLTPALEEWGYSDGA